MGLSDPVLGYVSSAEQPLSVRHPGGCVGDVAGGGWFALAYAQRRCVWWEAALVLGGGVVALLRAGNLWVLALALVVPLGARAGEAADVPVIEAGGRAGGALVGGYLLLLLSPLLFRRRRLTPWRRRDADSAILSDARWANDLQQRLGS